MRLMSNLKTVLDAAGIDMPDGIGLFGAATLRAIAKSAPRREPLLPTGHCRAD